MHWDLFQRRILWFLSDSKQLFNITKSKLDAKLLLCFFKSFQFLFFYFSCFTSVVLSWKYFVLRSIFEFLKNRHQCITDYLYISCWTRFVLFFIIPLLVFLFFIILYKSNWYSVYPYVCLHLSINVTLYPFFCCSSKVFINIDKFL